MSSVDLLDDVAMGILRQAKKLTITVDCKTLVDTPLAGTGYPAIIQAVTACSQGEKGWWGAGAKGD